MLENIHNYLPITPALTTSGQPTEEEISALADEGCELIINLGLHDDPRYSLKDEISSVNALGMQYIHIPVQFDRPLKSNLLAFFDAMEANRWKKIHVHCAANKRVTVFLGLYFYIRQGKTDTEAFEPMWEIWKPDAIWSAFIDSMVAEFHTL